MLAPSDDSNLQGEGFSFRNSGSSATLTMASEHGVLSAALYGRVFARDKLAYKCPK